MRNFCSLIGLVVFQLKGTQSADAHAHCIHFLADLYITRHAHEAHLEYLNKPCGVELIASQNRD